MQAGLYERLVRTAYAKTEIIVIVNILAGYTVRQFRQMIPSDTNMLYADRHPKSLEETVNKEQKKKMVYFLVFSFSLHNSPRLASTICELYMFF